MRKKDKKTKNNKHLKFKYWPFLFLILSGVVSICLSISFSFDFSSIDSKSYIDIIITLLPLIFTIITLSLSLPSEQIYGATFSTIRKIRKDKHFKFSEMIGINVFIFALLTIFLICNLVIQVWALDLIAIIYCIMFAHQEMPLLLKDNNKVKAIIKKSGYLDGKFNADDYDGAASNGSESLDMLKNIVLTDGIVAAYNSFKTNDDENNSILIDKLLSWQNGFLSKCSENREFLASISASEYKGIDILKATEIAFRNIKDCVESNKDFNYIQIAKTSNNYYQITRSIFCLKKIMETLNLGSKFKSLYDNFLHSIFMKMKFGKVNDDEKNFVYRILNSTMIYTVSNNETWFLESLRDSSFESKFIPLGDKNYFIFVCIYIYYICRIDKTVEDNLRKKLEEFIITQCRGLNSERSDNIVSIFNFNHDYSKFTDTADLIIELIQMIDAQGDHDIWYKPPFVRSWSSANGSFDKELLFNCWLILLFSSESFLNLDFEYLKNVFDSLGDENEKTLLYVVNKYWIKEGKFNLYVKSTGFLDFYKCNRYFDNRMSDVDFFKKFTSYFQERNKKEIVNQLNKNVVSDEQLLSYKNVLINQLNDAAKKNIFFNNNLEIDSKKLFNYSILFDSYLAESLIKEMNNQFERLIDKIVYDNLVNNKKIKKQINDKNKNTIIKTILDKKYDYRNGREYIFHDLGISNEKLNEIRKIKEYNGTWVPNCSFWKKGAIQLNLVCYEKETQVRRLSRDEINKIIDRDYSQVDGLYKYSDSTSDNRSIFISREELYEFIYKKYFYAVIVFSFRFFVDFNNMISIFKNNDKGK